MSKVRSLLSRCLAAVDSVGDGRGRLDRSSQGIVHGVPVYQTEVSHHVK